MATTSSVSDGPAHDLLALGEFLRRRLMWILVPTLLALLAGLVVGLVARPVYRAEVKVIPADRDRLASTMSDVAGRLGGLVGLAGIGGVGSTDSRLVSVELLKSRSLAKTFIEENDLTGRLLDCAAPTNLKNGGDDCDLSIDRAVREFDRKIRRVTEDRRTGIVSLHVDWYDADDAALWANGLVRLLNSQLRKKAVADAEKNIGYLTRQLQVTNSIETRDALYRLVEVELKNAMLAEVSEEFALQVIDPASAPGPEDIQRPKKWLLMLGGLATGLMIGFLLAVAMDLRALSKVTT